LFGFIAFKLLDEDPILSISIISNSISPPTTVESSYYAFFLISQAPTRKKSPQMGNPIFKQGRTL
jgi:hypothetical protein